MRLEEEGYRFQLTLLHLPKGGQAGAMEGRFRVTHEDCKEPGGEGGSKAEPGDFQMISLGKAENDLRKLEITVVAAAAVAEGQGETAADKSEVLRVRSYKFSVAC